MRIGKKALINSAAAVAAALAASPAVTSASPIASIYTTENSGNPYTLTGTVSAIVDSFTSSNTTKDTFILQDATGGAFFYEISTAKYSPTVGDNITVTANDSAYQGSPEMVNTGFSLDSINSTGNPVSPTVLTIPQLNASGNGTTGVPPYAETLVELENVYLPAGTTTLANKTSYTLTGWGGSTTLYTYGTYSNVLAADNAANAEGASFLQGPLDIIGYADEYYGVVQLEPLSFTAGVVPEPASFGLLAAAALTLMHRRTRKSEI